MQNEIAELLQKQESFLLNSMCHAVIAVNSEGKIMAFNHAARELFDPLNICLRCGFPLAEQGFCPSMATAVADTIALGNVYYLREDTFESGGQNIRLGWDISPLYRENGKIAGAILVIEDLTASRQLDLIKSNKLESICSLAAGIAHDFNNYLVSMLANLSLIRLYQNDWEKIHAKLESTEAAINRAKGLARQLFSFARGSEPVKKTVHIGDLIRESTAFALSGSAIEAEFCLDEDLLPVHIDEDRIFQVITNIVINAKQAMLHGGSISVKAKNINVAPAGRDQKPLAHLPQGQYVMFCITDQGCGIPQEYLVKIFDPFFSTKPGGSGLGLATSYTIIQNHHGHMDVKSEPGKGTTFYIYLPA